MHYSSARRQERYGSDQPSKSLLLPMYPFDQWLSQTLNRLNSLNSLDKWLPLLLCTLWGIWKDRNKVMFSSDVPNPVNVIRQAQLSLQDCTLSDADNTTSATNLNMVPRSRNQASWRGEVKLNTDATWINGSRFSSISIVARDHIGQVLTGLASGICCPSPLSLCRSLSS